jgi:hypothetical protein
MRIIPAAFFLGIFVFSCRNDTQEKLKKSALSAAENYIVNQLTIKERTVTEKGIILFGSDEKRYAIDPSDVITGMIDDDNEPDAIVSVSSVSENRDILTEHLVMISVNGKLILIRSVERDMKVLALNSRIITAKVPTHPRSSPLHNCEACQEIRNYRFLNGDLQEIK